MSNVDQAREHYEKAAKYMETADRYFGSGPYAVHKEHHDQKSRDARAMADTFVRLAEVALGLTEDK